MLSLTRFWSQGVEETWIESPCGVTNRTVRAKGACTRRQRRPQLPAWQVQQEPRDRCRRDIPAPEAGLANNLRDLRSLSRIKYRVRCSIGVYAGRIRTVHWQGVGEDGKRHQGAGGGTGAVPRVTGAGAAVGDGVGGKEEPPDACGRVRGREPGRGSWLWVWRRVDRSVAHLFYLGKCGMMVCAAATSRAMELPVSLLLARVMGPPSLFRAAAVAAGHWA